MTNLAPPGYQTIFLYGPAKIVVVTGKNDCRCSPAAKIRWVLGSVLLINADKSEMIRPVRVDLRRSALGWMWRLPSAVHRDSNEGLGEAVARRDASRRDRANAADSDLVWSRLADRPDLLEPFDLDPIRELHDLGPPIGETLPAAAAPPVRVPHVRVPVLPRAGIDPVDHIRRRVAGLLQQSNISTHLHKLAPRRVLLGDVPTHNRRRHLDLVILQYAQFASPVSAAVEIVQDRVDGGS